MGWSQGGATTLSVIDQKRDDPFRSAVAIYPYCNRMLFDLNAPLLILIGEKDDWTPDNMCSMRMRSGQTGLKSFWPLESFLDYLIHTKNQHFGERTRMQIECH